MSVYIYILNNFLIPSYTYIKVISTYYICILVFCSARLAAGLMAATAAALAELLQEFQLGALPSGTRNSK